MPASKPGLTFAEHQKIGGELRRIYRQLTDNFSIISKAYGPSSKASKAGERALKYLNRLRSDLDNEVSRENPERSDAEVTACYYGEGECRGSE
jgi:hypothetical protein